MLAQNQQQFRQQIDLCGIWNFKLDEDDEGLDGFWMDAKLYAPRLIPVPASYNDITTDFEIHQNEGPVWYQTAFVRPKLAENEDLYIVFESASHEVQVFINDQKVAEHTGSSIKFEANISDALKDDRTQLLSVRISGSDKEGLLYDYKGIDGKVYLEIRPTNYIENVKFITRGLTPLATGGIDFAQCEYEITASSNAPAKVVLKNFKGDIVYESKELQDSFKLDKPILWSPEMPYLYTLCISVGDDYYEQQVGIKSTLILENQLLLNNQAIKLHGFTFIKDYAFSGKAMSDVQLAHDMELMSWMGANCLCSTSSSLSETILNWADKSGLLVLDLIDTFNKDELSRLLSYKQNHASLIGWIVKGDSNNISDIDAHINLIRELDPAHRPIFIQIAPEQARDFTSFGDALLLDYSQLVTEAKNVNEYIAERMTFIDELCQDHTKPLLIANYSPEAQAAYRSYFEENISEDFQVSALAQFGSHLDANSYILGEIPCALADYSIKGSRDNALALNQSGVFTRNREAKTSSYTLRVRWHMLDGKEF